MEIDKEEKMPVVILLIMLVGILIGLVIVESKKHRVQGDSKEAETKTLEVVVTEDKQGVRFEPEHPATFTFDDLLDAIEWVESKGDPNAKGDKTLVWQDGNRKRYEYKAIGAYQLHKIYVDDVNRIMQICIDEYQPLVDSGTVTKCVPVVISGEDTYRFTYEDRLDWLKSRVMTQIYLEYYGEGLSLLETAALHCAGPDGDKQMDQPSVKEYVEKIRVFLDNPQK